MANPLSKPLSKGRIKAIIRPAFVAIAALVFAVSAASQTTCLWDERKPTFQASPHQAPPIEIRQSLSTLFEPGEIVPNNPPRILASEKTSHGWIILACAMGRSHAEGLGIARWGLWRSGTWACKLTVEGLMGDPRVQRLKAPEPGPWLAYLGSDAWQGVSLRTLDVVRMEGDELKRVFSGNVHYSESHSLEADSGGLWREEALRLEGKELERREGKLEVRIFERKRTGRRQPGPWRVSSQTEIESP